MKAIIQKEARKKFKEYMKFSYGVVEWLEPKKENMFEVILEEKPKKSTKQKVAKVIEKDEYIPLFPLHFMKGYKRRINAYYGDIYICPLDIKQKLECQKDFDDFKLKGMGIDKIKVEMGKKYKVGHKRKSKRKTVEEAPIEIPKLYKRKRTLKSGQQRTRFAIKQNGKEIGVGNCNPDEEEDFTMEFKILWSRGKSLEDIKKILAKYELPRGRKPQKEKPNAPKKEVSEWDKLTWNERAHLLNDGEDTKIFASDFLDICSIMANGGNGRALASHFSNVEFGTLMFLGKNYNTPRFNELYDQGKEVMNSMRGF